MNDAAPALVAVLFLAAIGTLAQSAAVVDKSDKEQSLMTSEELFDVVNGGCEDGRVANCRTLPLFNYTDLLPPRSDAAGDILQDENCPSKHLERHLRCVDIFTRRCLTAEQRRTFYMLYTVPTLDMQELCTENGPHREEYLKHAACLRVAHSQYVQCGRKHKHELSALMLDQNRQLGDASTTSEPSNVNNEHITQNLLHLCGSFKGHLQCVHGIIRATCGPETEAFASQFLIQMASSLLNLCEKYGVGGNSNSNDASVSQSNSSGATKTSGATGAAAVAATVAILAASRRR